MHANNLMFARKGKWYTYICIQKVKVIDKGSVKNLTLPFNEAF